MDGWHAVLSSSSAQVGKMSWKGCWPEVQTRTTDNSITVNFHTCIRRMFRIESRYSAQSGTSASWNQQLFTRWWWLAWLQRISSWCRRTFQKGRALPTEQEGRQVSGKELSIESKRVISVQWGILVILMKHTPTEQLLIQLVSSSVKMSVDQC